MTVSRHKIPRSIARRVRQQARSRCGYCLCSELLLGTRLEFEHLIALAAEGRTIEENLWLACRRCNGCKGIQVRARDPQTGETVALFNPRQQAWDEHFSWSADGTMINGRTACGRATVEALKLNSPEIVATRRRWVSVGWWPPVD